MKLKIFLSFILISFSLAVHCQIYDDYIGAGHMTDVKITTSHEEKTDIGQNTMNGHGFSLDASASSRFLAQATLGANYNYIQYVKAIGIEAWLDEQFEMDPDYLMPDLDIMEQEFYDMYIASGGNPDEFFFSGRFFRYAWWNKHMKSPDLLRFRTALALSEILVISDQALGNHADALGTYYDLLIKHSFGNYRDLLLDIAMNPSMGFYLSHLNNPRSNPAQNVHPDENFARELMQLFTIGLYELNLDGSRKTDQNGDWIPTYDNEIISDMAKVWTGLRGGAWAWDEPGLPDFGVGIYGIDLAVPMVMDPNWHEPGPKTLLNGFVIPAGQTPMQDINDAIDNVFNHPNVGPFIGRLLIQRMIKSNPTPQYIERIATVFNDNGEGVRGDLKAVIRAILTDPEARDCEWLDDPHHGMLKEPMVRYMQILKSLDAYNEIDEYNNNGWNTQYNFLQHPLSAPSVFNFFLPDYQPLGEIKDNDLVAPEFQILNSVTSIRMINSGISWAFDWWTAMDTHIYDFVDDIFIPMMQGDPNWVRLDRSELNALADDHEALIERINTVLCHGLLSENTKETLREILNRPEDWLELETRVSFCLWVTFMSPDFVILR